MARRRLIWEVAPIYILVILFCTAGVAWYAGDAVSKFYREESERQLRQKVELLIVQFAPFVRDGEEQRIQELCRLVGAAANLRITVIAVDGRVVGDSDSEPGTMDNHASRPEVRQALEGREGNVRRFSHTVRAELMYLARPMRGADGQAVGVVRVAMPMDQVEKAMSAVYYRIAMGGLITAAVAGLVSLALFTRRISRPLQRLQSGAERFASGQLEQNLQVPDTEEIARLAETLNSMARQLDEKIRTIVRQSRERQAVLSSMIEGVLAVDRDERIITFNQAAAGFIGVDPELAQGRRLMEVVRNVQLQELVTSALSGGGPVEGEVSLNQGGKERFLQAQATMLHDERDASGAVLVLHDVTRLRQLEKVRQDFVANVSHELKTPITAIKAAVETLIDDRSGMPPASARFLSMIARQADRLNAIVEDLLTLARLEQGEERGHIELSRGRVLPVLKGAVETCQPKADASQIELHMEAEEGLQAQLNSPLLEQAVVNLLDNAIKYSPKGSRVDVSARRENGDVVISVKDRGHGIEQKHLPRLFERFYRTDQARSREMGGTGLGLSIVKHVVQSHGGRVTVTSTPGPSAEQGSEFRIVLPAVKSALAG